MIKFVKDSAGAGKQAVAEELLQALTSGQPVLWLVSGGSNINLEAEIMRSLPAKLTSQLIVMLSDERYGPVGHADSNYQQLLDAGFDSKEASFIPVLQNGLTLEETAEQFASNFEQASVHAGAIIAQLGMGADGHTAGILPGSPAATSVRLTASFAAADYQRVTLTFSALRRISTAYLLAYGENKRAQLEKLQGKLPLDEQPAQILKEIPTAYIYNDQLD